MEQKPPAVSEISVAFPMQHDWQRLEEIVMIDKSKLFMANPPPSSVSYDNMTDLQRWAVDLGTDKRQQILYICGKAGSGKTEVALTICERLKGKVRDKLIIYRVVFDYLID